MSGEKKVRCRRCGVELYAVTDDLEERLCADCPEELEEEEEYYEETQDADELDSMLGEYEGDW